MDIPNFNDFLVTVSKGDINEMIENAKKIGIEFSTNNLNEAFNKTNQNIFLISYSVAANLLLRYHNWLTNQLK